MVYGYDGREAKAYRMFVDLQLGEHLWQKPVIFSDAVTRQGLLGQMSFFDYFDVTFKYRERVFEVRRVGQ